MPLVENNAKDCNGAENLRKADAKALLQRNAFDQGRTHDA
jgi:hypothetical protein